MFAVLSVNLKRPTSQSRSRVIVSRSPAPTPPILPSPPFTRLEILLLAAILVTGAALRLFVLSHSAVEHFDEGVYASNLYFGPPDYAYPQQRFFGPPLLPALIETGMVLLFPPNVAALLPSFLAGCGTIVALWWIGRSWFGPPAGLTAAGLAAFSDFQILFSTSALTDTLLGLWLLLAVDAIARSLAKSDLRWAVGAGLYTGLAWWTKYNGWLPLAIEAAAIPLLFLVAIERRGQLKVWLACFALTAFVAAAAWSPFLFSLQSHGGYAPIAANHAKYFVGLAGWANSVSRQLANQHVLSSWLGSLGIFVAVSLPALFGERTPRQRLVQCGIAASLGLSAWIFTSIVVLVTASSIGLLQAIISLWLQRNRTPLTSDLRPLTFISILAVWWLGLLLSTPCYTPYARLLLPFTLAAYLAAPLFVCGAGLWPAPQLIPRLQPGNALPRGSASSMLEQFLQQGLPLMACAALLAASIIAAIFLPPPQLKLADSRLSLQAIAQEIRKTSDQNTPRVIYTFAEPALYFQLRAAGEEVVAPVQDIPATATSIDGRPIPTFLLTGPHTEQDPRFQQQWAAAGSNWILLQTFDYLPSPLVYLDLHDPRLPDTTSHSIRLYQRKIAND